jgi:2,3,4,5-tetrahydropyridine-2-carboxylate N-succinyltransferase
VPGAIVRRSAFIAKNVVLMPSFVNLGAYVDEATMIDTWSTVGSCAQIGKRVHISGRRHRRRARAAAGRSGHHRGRLLHRRALGSRRRLSCARARCWRMGVFLGASTKIVDRETGETFIGEVPEYSVLVPGTLPGKPLKNGQPARTPPAR